MHGPACDACWPDNGLLSSMSDRLAMPRERQLIEQLRIELAPDLSQVPPFADDVIGEFRLLRSLRAFDHNVSEAAAAIRSHLALRREQGLDAIRDSILNSWRGRLWDLRTEHLPHGDLVCKYMPEVFVFGRAKSGDPIGLALWGRGRPGAFVQEVDNWQEKFMEHYFYMNEARMLLLDQVSREQGRLGHFIQVFDLEGWNMVSNSDRTWSAFTNEQAGPAGETYHDCNSFFLAIRTTRLARVAYNMIKPLIPHKVKEKVRIYGDDFFKSAVLRDQLVSTTVERLARKSYSLPSPTQKGLANIKPRQYFELHVRVPLGGKLCWSFGVDGGSRWRQSCIGEWLPRNGPDLEFSLRHPLVDSSERVSTDEFVQGWEPRRVQGDCVCGNILRYAEKDHSSSYFVLRWDNSHALFSHKCLRYEVSVDSVDIAPRLKAESGKDVSENDTVSIDFSCMVSSRLAPLTLLLGAAVAVGFALFYTSSY